MLRQFRVAVFDVLDEAIDETTAQVCGSIPDDVAQLPAIVVGRPSVDEGVQGTFDLALEIYVVGRRLETADRDPEIDNIADEILSAFGGTHAVTRNGQYLHLSAVDSRIVDIAGLAYPAYTCTVETSAATC